MCKNVEKADENLLISSAYFANIVTYANNGENSMKNKEKRKEKKAGKIIAGVLITILIIGIAGCVAAVLLLPPGTVRLSKRTVNGYDIRDYERADLENLLVSEYDWDLKLVAEDIEIKIEDPIKPQIMNTLDQAYSMKRGFQYTIELSEDTINQIIDSAVNEAVSYNIDGTNGDIMEYDAEIDDFIFNDHVQSKTLREDELRTALSSVLENKEYNSTIEMIYDREEVAVTADDYKMLSTFTTHTTANSDRNNNVNLACETINGLIIQPGDSFSYNETLGERTKEKGYKEAGAYLNGEHVIQYGGGICQVSSTLYNAIFAANIHVDQRTGHTFEPTYVRPGLDATVSYPQPDFQFTNNSGNPIGIRAHYEDRTVTVEIYGVPTLEEGVTRYMTSQKTATLDPPAYTFQDNVALQYNQQIVVAEPKCGSKWATYEVLEKDGEVISETFIYTTVYKGEAGIIQRNLTLDSMVAAQRAQQAAQ